MSGRTALLTLATEQIVALLDPELFENLHPVALMAYVEIARRSADPPGAVGRLLFPEGDRSEFVKRLAARLRVLPDKLDQALRLLIRNGFLRAERSGISLENFDCQPPSAFLKSVTPNARELRRRRGRKKTGEPARRRPAKTGNGASGQGGSAARGREPSAMDLSPPAGTRSAAPDQSAGAPPKISEEINRPSENRSRGASSGTPRQQSFSLSETAAPKAPASFTRSSAADLKPDANAGTRRSPQARERDAGNVRWTPPK